MLTALRLTGVALIALFAGFSVPAHAPNVRSDTTGAYDWVMLDHEQYEGLFRRWRGDGLEVAGTLVLTRSSTGYDARMTSARLATPHPFLVSTVDDRTIVYTDTEMGELRFDLPSVPEVAAEWTLRSEEWGELHGRLEVSRR